MVFAEFEREMIRERGNGGLDRVRGEIDRKSVFTTKSAARLSALAVPVRSRISSKKRRRCLRLVTVS
jgi:hypothetical protein